MCVCGHVVNKTQQRPGLEEVLIPVHTCQKPADVDWNKYCQSESITAVFSSATVC